MRRINKSLALFATLLLVALVFVVFLKLDAGTTPEKQEQITTAVATSSPTIAFPKDIPLYTGISWGAPVVAKETIGTSTMDGIEVVSAGERGVTDIAGETGPIEDYYHSFLLQNGWTEDQDAAADGAGSSVRVYIKGTRFVVISYSSIPENPAEEGPLTCPCTLHMQLFVSS